MGLLLWIDLAGGLDAAPDAKVDQEPHEGQRSDQLPAQFAGELEAVGDHQHAASASTPSRAHRLESIEKKIV